MRTTEHSPGSTDPLALSFAELLTGLEWSEALLVIASFDASALCRMSPTPESTHGPDHEPKTRDGAGAMSPREAARHPT